MTILEAVSEGLDLKHANERARNGVDGSYEIQDKTRTE